MKATLDGVSIFIPWQVCLLPTDQSLLFLLLLPLLVLQLLYLTVICCPYKKKRKELTQNNCFRSIHFSLSFFSWSSIKSFNLDQCKGNQSRRFIYPSIVHTQTSKGVIRPMGIKWKRRRNIPLEIITILSPAGWGRRSSRRRRRGRRGRRRNNLSWSDR